MDKRHVTFLLYDGLHLVDVAGPAEAMRHAGGYTLRFASIDGRPVRAQCGLSLSADGAIAETDGPSDLLIPGGDGVEVALRDPTLLQAVANWRQYRPDARLISICSGALLLAEAGVLDGRQATTHWCRTEQVRRSWPQVRWQLNDIHVNDGAIWTSAGVTSGIDLALALIRQDRGAPTALAVARQMLVSVQRGGGQDQYATLLEAQYSSSDRLAPLIQAISEHPGHDWTLSGMADFAALTPRTLSRQFQRELGFSPARFVERVRTDWAGNALAGGAAPHRVAEAAGFGDLQRMDRAFQRQHDCSSRSWLRRFGTTDQARRSLRKISDAPQPAITATASDIRP